jgi:AcrR family transcriptional regulator
VSTPAGQPLGLRERKKLKLRRTIQAEALRLFEARGYEQTTVEEIAEAAETSTTTFYRYFPTKEDVVLDDDYDAMIEAFALARPRDEPVADTFRAVLAQVLARTEADSAWNLTRMRLMATVPALDARFAGEERKTADLTRRILAERTGRSPDDFQLALTAAALVAVLFTATRRWAAGGGAVPMSSLLDQAVATVEPVLANL